MLAVCWLVRWWLVVVMVDSLLVFISFFLFRCLTSDITNEDALNTRLYEMSMLECMLDWHAIWCKMWLGWWQGIYARWQVIDRLMDGCGVFSGGLIALGWMRFPPPKRDECVMSVMNFNAFSKRCSLSLNTLHFSSVCVRSPCDNNRPVDCVCVCVCNGVGQSDEW